MNVLKNLWRGAFWTSAADYRNDNAAADHGNDNTADHGNEWNSWSDDGSRGCWSNDRHRDDHRHRDGDRRQHSTEHHLRGPVRGCDGHADPVHAGGCRV